MALSVLLADDHQIVRRGLRRLIDSDERFEVKAEAPNGAEAVRLCVQNRPDVAVLDVNMPVTNGITAAAEIKSACPETGIVILTFQLQVDVIRAALEAGADGFILKDSPEEELFAAIESASRGKRYLAQGAAEIVLETFLFDKDATQPESTGHTALHGTSGRERQVLQMLAEGESNTRIATTLNLSPKTVETYRSRLMHKLNVTSFAELVRVAVRAGLVDREG